MLSCFETVVCTELKLSTLSSLPEILGNHQIILKKEKAIKGLAISLGGLFLNTFLHLQAEPEGVFIRFTLEMDMRVNNVVGGRSYSHDGYNEHHL